MIRALSALALLASLAAGCAAGPAGALAARAQPADRLILVMAADPGIDRLDLSGARSGPYRQPHGYPGLPLQIARAMQALAAEHGLRPVDQWPMLSLGVQCMVFEGPQGADIDALLARLAADPRVESAQRMNRFELRTSGDPAHENDPYRSLQRSLDELEVSDAHRWSTGRGVRVAVIDTGVEVQHPDLEGQVAESKDFVGGIATADRHGTAVAGVIAARASNRLGIVGVAPGARLLALRACQQRQAAGKGSCTTFDLARAIDHAIDARADVVNLSLGGPRDRLLERLLTQAIARDIVVVAAEGEDGASFPATLDGVIAVGGDRSRVTPQVLSAPDVDVLSLAPPDGYDWFSGSSMAAAQVSGIVALLLERAPGLQAAEIRGALLRSARRFTAADDDARLQVNACAALAAVRAEVRCGAACTEPGCGQQASR